MKRAKDFAVVLGQSEFDQEQADQIISDAKRTSSWHKVWDLIQDEFSASYEHFRKIWLLKIKHAKFEQKQRSQQRERCR